MHAAVAVAAVAADQFEKYRIDLEPGENDRLIREQEQAVSPLLKNSQLIRVFSKEGGIGDVLVSI